MQMNKPKDLVIDGEAIAKTRLMKYKQEPITIKVCMLLRHFLQAQENDQ